MDSRDTERESEAAQERAFASSGAYEWLLDQFAEIDRKYRVVSAHAPCEPATAGAHDHNSEQH